MYGKIINQIATGAYSKVYETDQNYAVKVRKNGIDGEMPDFLREIAVLNFLKHPNIITVYNFTLVDDYRYMYMPLGVNTFEDYLLSEDKIDNLTIYYMYNLLTATDYCHINGIIHRDIKPQNILLFSDGSLKLADFGMAKWGVSDGQTHTGGLVTIWWRAPEILLGDIYYDFLIDIWSIGIILFSIYGYKYVQGRNERSQLKRIYSIIGIPTEEIWPGVTKLPKWKDVQKIKLVKINEIIINKDIRDLTLKMLSWKPYRFSARQLLNHSLFDNYPKFQSKIINVEDVPIKLSLDKLRRKDLFEWIWELSLEFKAKPSTILLAFNIMDRYFTSSSEIDDKGYALTILLIAIKMREFIYWGFDSFLTKYSVDELKKFESNILDRIDYVLMTPYIHTLLKCKDHLMRKLICLYLNYDLVIKWSPSRFMKEVVELNQDTCHYLIDLKSPIAKNLVIL